MQETLQNPCNLPPVNAKRFLRFPPSAAETNWSWAEDRHHHCWCRSCQSQRWNVAQENRLQHTEYSTAISTSHSYPMSVPHVTCFGAPRLCETSMDLQHLGEVQKISAAKRETNLHPLVYPKKGVAIWTQLETSWMKYSATIKWWLKDRVGQSLQDCMWWWFCHDFAISIASDFKRCGCPWSFRSSDIIDTIDDIRWYTCTDAEHETTTGTSRLMIWRAAKRWEMLICPQSLPSALQGDQPRPLQDKGARITSHGPQPADAISNPAFPMLMILSYHSIITALFLGMTHAQGAPKKESQCTVNVVQIRFQDLSQTIAYFDALDLCQLPKSSLERKLAHPTSAAAPQSPAAPGVLSTPKGKHPAGLQAVPPGMSKNRLKNGSGWLWSLLIFVGCFSHWRTWQMYNTYGDIMHHWRAYWHHIDKAGDDSDCTCNSVCCFSMKVMNPKMP